MRVIAVRRSVSFCIWMAIILALSCSVSRQAQASCGRLVEVAKGQSDTLLALMRYESLDIWEKIPPRLKLELKPDRWYAFKWAGGELRSVMQVPDCSFSTQYIFKQGRRPASAGGSYGIRRPFSIPCS